MASTDSWPTEWPEPQKGKVNRSRQLAHGCVSILLGLAVVICSVGAMGAGAFIWDSLLVSYPPAPPPPPPVVAYDPTPLAPLAPPADASRCVIDLITNRHNCHSLAGIAFEQEPRNGQAVVKLTLDPFETQIEAVRFNIDMGQNVSGWAVNIGDSATNNGNAGDAGTQSHDAEMQIQNGRLSVFGSDYTPPEATTDSYRHLVSIDGFAMPRAQVVLEVSNNRLSWWGTNQRPTTIEEPYLFALTRQPDESGASNYDVYAAFNRVIAQPEPHSLAVHRVELTLIRSDQNN